MPVILKPGHRIRSRGSSRAVFVFVFGQNRPVRFLGDPKLIRDDNGPEFVSHDLDLWGHQKAIVWTTR